MSQLRKCDICGQMIEQESQLPDCWTSLSKFSIDKDNMHFGQIDICNVCRSSISEFYEDLEHYTYAKAKTSKEVLRFILGLDNREKN